MLKHCRAKHLHPRGEVACQRTPPHFQQEIKSQASGLKSRASPSEIIRRGLGRTLNLPTFSALAPESAVRPT